MRDYTRFAPLARQLTDEYRCRLVMGDKLPREIENPLYRYLIAISKLRLGILTEQGEGSRSYPILRHGFSQLSSVSPDAPRFPP